MSIGRIRTAAAGIFAAALVVVAADAGATSMVKFDMEDLSHIADVIVVGEVERVDSELQLLAGPRLAKQITTRTTVKVIDAWKGPHGHGASLVVREIGGRVEKEMMVVDGTAGFLEGERVLLFLQYDASRNEYWMVGWTQGKFTLLRNGANGWNVAKLRIPVEEWGRAFDPAADTARTTRGADLADVAVQVKRVVEADAKAGVNWREMPEYRGIAR